MYQLEFEKLIEYDLRQSGITIDVELKHGTETAAFAAKVDTGASFCIFERKHGESLDLEIEQGLFQTVGTATGSFVVYGFSLTLAIAEFEFDSFVYFAANENFAKNVLGRGGWLDKLVLGLDDYDGKLYLKPHEWL